ncbi:MAG: hypothetical protein R3B72_25445 [Polyangiaceae bacterium]
MSFWKKVSAPLLLIGLASPALVNCDALGGLVPGMDCPALKDGNFAQLKFEASAEVNAQLTGFLEAVYSLDQLALEMETNLIASCGELGLAIGMDEASVTAEPSGGEGAKKVCMAVAEKIKGTLSAAGSVSLSVDIGAPSCKADIDALMDCYAGCGAAIDPGEISASCEGGEISGKCSGECKGSCTVEAGAQCGGTCGAKCEGECDGECSAKNEDGSCAGKCDGTCNGTCSASCKVEGKADCSGECSGGCSVEMEAPKCSGEFKPPSVSADCQMNCSAKTAAKVQCDPPSVNIKVEGEASADIQALVDGLQVALPKIVNIQIGMGQRLVAQGKALVEAGQALPSIAANAGLQAVGCIAGAAEMAVSASASVSVNVEASASVSGSVGG